MPSSSHGKKYHEIRQLPLIANIPNHTLQSWDNSNVGTFPDPSPRVEGVACETIPVA